MHALSLDLLGTKNFNQGNNTKMYPSLGRVIIAQPDLFKSDTQK